jgi:hypothetical protein
MLTARKIIFLVHTELCAAAGPRLRPRPIAVSGEASESVVGVKISGVRPATLNGGSSAEHRGTPWPDDAANPGEGRADGRGDDVNGWRRGTQKNHRGCNSDDANTERRRIGRRAWGDSEGVVFGGSLAVFRKGRAAREVVSGCQTNLLIV